MRATVTDPDQIRQILDASVSDELDLSNSLNPEYTGIQITAYVKTETSEEQGTTEDIEFSDFPETFDESGEEAGYALHFDGDRIPSFVIKEFGLTEAMIQEDTTDS